MKLIPTSSPGVAQSAVHLQHGHHLHPPPPTAPPLVSAPRAACLRLPPCTACAPPPPLFSLSLISGPCHPLGGFSHSGFLCVSLPLTCPPSCSAVYWHLLVFVFFVRCFFCEKARGQGASTPWQLLSLSLSPPSTWTCRRLSGYPDPPPPLVVLIKSPLVESVGSTARRAWITVISCFSNLVKNGLGSSYIMESLYNSRKYSKYQQSKGNSLQT